MKRTTNLLTMTTIALAAAMITLVVSQADANKRHTLEASDIAFVDVFKLVDLGLGTEAMTAERDQFNSTAAAELSGLEQQLQALQTQMAGMQQTDPNAATAYNQFQQLQYQLNQKTTQINNSYQTLIADQIARTYEEIYAAANEIGTQQGYSFVLSTRTDGELLQTESITGITQEILARPLMTPASEIDLTEMVRVQLNYPEKAEAPAEVEIETESTPETTEESTTTDAEAEQGVEPDSEN